VPLGPWTHGRAPLRLRALAIIAMAAVSGCGGGGGTNTSRASSAAPSSTTSAAVPVTAAPAATAPVATTAPTEPTAGPARTFAVGIQKSTFVDASRATPATSGARGANTRTLPTTIWYPAEGVHSAADAANAPPATRSGPFPLVIWGHGWNLAGRHYQSFLHRWASAGYVIAAPNFPTSTSDGNGAGPAGGDDESAEPGDLSFVATSVIRLNADSSSPLYRLVDARRVVAAGHSQGAVDALAMAFAACCRDARVGAAVVVAGIDVPERFGAYRFATHTPVLLEQGDQDPYLSVGGARQLYSRLASPKYLLVLRGTDHNTSKGDATSGAPRVLSQAVVDFCDRYVKGVAGGLLERDAGAAPFAELAEAP